MKSRAAVFGLALLVALPAWAQRGGHSGGHSGGTRSSGGGVQGAAASHGAPASHAGVTTHVSVVAPASASASHVASAPRAQSGSTMLGGRVVFVPPPTTGRVQASARPVNVPPRPTNSTASVVAPTYPSRVTLAPMAASTTPQRMVTTSRPVRPNFAVVPPPPTVVVTPSGFPLFQLGVFGQQIFFQNSVAFIGIGDGFFFSFFFGPVGFDPFLANPFCPFCATGRVDLPPFQRGIFSPFAPRRVFFDAFLENRFFSPFARSPFFFGGFFPTFVPAFDTGLEFDGAAMTQAPAGEANTAVVGMQPEEAPQANQAAEQPASPPITLLVLKDGSMYGLVDYWLEDSRLHYITSYGGENSLPLDRIDFDKTVQLNWERSIEFVLHPTPRSR